jgi:hypothetical protein
MRPAGCDRVGYACSSRPRRAAITIRITLPADVALGSSEGAAVGGHEVQIEGRHVLVTPAAGAGHIEVVLRDLFLRTLVVDAGPWLRELGSVLERMGADAFMVVDGPTISDPGWVDRYVYCGDLSQRMLFERRRAGRPGRPVLWVLDTTGTPDLCQNAKTGRLDPAPNRSAMSRALNLTRGWATDGTVEDVDGLAIVNLLTARSGPTRAKGAYRPPSLDTLPAADSFVARAAAGAALIVAAWGSLEDDYHAQRLTRIIEAADKQVHGLVTERKGRMVRWLTTDAPPQPRATRGLSTVARPVPLEELRADRSLPLP